MVDCSSSTSIVSPSPREDLEPGWVQSSTLPRCFSQSRISSTSSSSSFTTSLVVSPRQGPASLPAELVNSAQREVRRLQELRRYIQEECDQLLLRKERLREEVSSSLHHPHATKQASHHHGKGHRVAAEEVMVRTVATQAPSSLLSV